MVYMAPLRRPRTGGMKKGWKAPKTLAKEEARAYLRDRVIADLAPLYEAQSANARGLKYLVARDRTTGKFRRLTEEALKDFEEQDESKEVIEVWEKDPNVSAFTDLLNRALDKPKEQMQELEVKVTGIEAIIKAGRERVARGKSAKH